MQFKREPAAGSADAYRSVYGAGEATVSAYFGRVL